MFHKIKSVRSLDNYILEIVFENDIIKYYDVSKLFEKWTVFKQLKAMYEQEFKDGVNLIIDCKK